MDQDKDESGTSMTEDLPKIASDAPSSLSNLFGDDDDSEDDEESVGVAAAKSNPEKQATKQSSAVVDYDENDSDVEFDDAQAEIVGTARPENSEEQAYKSSEQQQQQMQAHSNTKSGQQQSRGSEQMKPLPPKTISVPDIPRPFVPENKEKKITLHMTKLPHMLAIIPTAYDRDTFDPHEEAEMYGAERLVSTIIRWRYVRDAQGEIKRDPKTGKLMRESNARIIQWSDGTKSIKIGQEIFDIEERINTPAVSASSTAETAATVAKKNSTARHFLFMSQRAVQVPDDANPNVTDEQEPTTVLACMGPIESKLSARPSSLQSSAHKALTLQVRQRTVKRAKITEIVTRADPEAEKAKRIAAKNTLIKAEMGKATMGRYNRSSTGSGRSRARRYEGDLSEEEERYDTFNISDMKRRAKDVDEEALDFGDSDEEEEWEKSRSWKNQKDKQRKQKLKEADESEDEELFQEQSDSEEEEAPIRAKHKKAKIGVLEDDEDED